jgi:lipopolysaccharide export system protein LptA
MPIAPIRPRSHRAIFALFTLLCSSLSLAQIDNLRLPISLDADSTDYDGKSSMLMFRGLRLTQGSIGIEADEGRASKLDFEDSTWHFAGNVIIDTENGHIECESADLDFSGHQLRLATISGSPATFEMKRPDSDEITYAQAGRLEYDFATGVVEFSEQATITGDGNQISSNYLVYNIIEQRISAQSGGDGEPKVRITYTPGSTDDEAIDLGSDQTGSGEPDTLLQDTGSDGEDSGDDRPVENPADASQEVERLR